jgi:hypothetical protein
MRAVSQAIPLKISTPSATVIFAGIVLASVLTGAGAVLFFFDPSKNDFYPVCLFHKLTGLNCPGCGATRSLYALLHGNFARAFRDNALFILTLVALAVRGGWCAVNFFLRQPAGNFFPPKSLWTFLVVALIFGVLRNLPAFAFLSP